MLVKKEYRNMKFDAVPKYKRIEAYLDFDHATLDEVIATTSDWDYTLEGKYSNYNSYCYFKSKDNPLISFVNSIKPDKLYFLFGQSDFLLVDFWSYFMIVYATVLRSRRLDYQCVDAHSVLLCVFEALSV